ncbi:hypothetical protein Q9233_008980 [Columba guinea]|nr:hypothetical protein Q9233_008980 [Columba guinea]
MALAFVTAQACAGLCTERFVIAIPSLASVVSERDYESLVMMRLRQAAERQQLIEQLQREDEAESLT